MLISSFTRRCVAQQGRGSSVSCKLQRYLLPKETTKNIAHLRQQQQIRERHNVVYFSSSSDKDALVQIDLEVETGIATITMNRAPANSLSLELCQAISGAIKEAESNKAIQGLILSSNLQKSNIFSAGLDLTEMYQPDMDRLRKFWHSFQQVYVDLYGSRLACMAAINGHAPAAGCMLALSCDYRLMFDNGIGKIGLNESAFGIVAPPWLGQQYIDTLGHRQAEISLSLGTLYNPAEALSIGLIDEIVTIPEAGGDGGGGEGEGEENQTPHDILLAKAKEQVMKWIRIPHHARVASKQFTRQKQIDHLLATRQEDIDHFCNFVTNERVQKSLGAYLESLRKSASKKKKQKQEGST